MKELLDKSEEKLREKSVEYYNESGEKDFFGIKIDNILEQEFSGFDEEDFSDLTFNIEVIANKKFFTKVPFSVIESGNIQKLMQYRESY
jgi:hypothetical protein